jgi:rhamnulokinase
VNAETGQWATDLLADLDLPARLFGEIVQPGAVIGPLATDVVSSLVGTPVVAPACHDTGSAVAAVAAGGDTAFLSSGTWSLVGTEVVRPIITDRSRDLNFTNEGGVLGTTRLLKNVNGLWLLQACRQTWAASGHAWSYDELVRAAAADERDAFGTIIDPDDPSFLSPEDMVEAIAAWCRRTHQPVPADPARLTRTILESLALKYRFVVEGLESITGVAIRTIHVVGGGAKNRLLNQFAADATGRTVLAGPVEATALGNIAMQMLATGAVSTLAEARAIISESFPVERYAPRDPERWHAPARRLADYMELISV